MQLSNNLIWRRFRRNFSFRIGTGIERLSELVYSTIHREGALAHSELEINRELLERAIEMGSEYLEKNQRANGSWRGFLLYPGVSNVWLTAHVAFVVENVPQLEVACLRAAHYLYSNGLENGGWGYNHRVGPDCDSTAQALLVLHRFKFPIKSFMLDFLLNAQCPKGGFPTYPDSGHSQMVKNGWQMPQPDVTAVVIELLRRLGVCPAHLQKALDWIKCNMHHELIPSYWWDGWSYGLWVQARACLSNRTSINMANKLLPVCSVSPEIPMVLLAAMQSNCISPTIINGIVALIANQHIDGSWSCGKCLRVTSAQCLYPDPEAPGKLYSDKYRVFSTAHAVASLELAKDLLF